MALKKKINEPPLMEAEHIIGKDGLTDPNPGYSKKVDDVDSAKIFSHNRYNFITPTEKKEDVSLRITLSPTTNPPLLPNSKSGLQNPRAVLFLSFWFFFSACTLFANKYILSYMGADPELLAMAQMWACISLGFFQMHYQMGMFPKSPTPKTIKLRNFVRQMLVLGSLRFSTLVLGLAALSYVAVSFTETVKSSAPLFTVIISRIIVGEKTGMCVTLSLIPIMFGLGLCSATELSFTAKGFAFALATNLSECLQNVYSKVLLSGERTKYSPPELQFYTSFASLAIQIPATFFLLDWATLQRNFDFHIIVALSLNGFLFHCQSICEYVLLEYITPVTHSVANTVKRALLIWMSILVFGNPVTLLSGLGTCIVIAGVLSYNKARELDQLQQTRVFDFHPQKIPP